MYIHGIGRDTDDRQKFVRPNHAKPVKKSERDIIRLDDTKNTPHNTHNTTKISQKDIQKMNDFREIRTLKIIQHTKVHDVQQLHAKKIKVKKKKIDFHRKERG